jgi:hypothetical protein
LLFFFEKEIYKNFVNFNNITTDFNFDSFFKVLLEATSKEIFTQKEICKSFFPLETKEKMKARKKALLQEKRVNTFQ